MLDHLLRQVNGTSTQGYQVTFWVWNQKQHKQEDIRTKGDCCFNHLVGLPKKDNVEIPMFEYERLLYDSLLNLDFYNPMQYTFKLKHLWVKKATGLGVTEFFLRFMAWLCLRNNDYRNSQMVIVTGPNQDIAIKLIKRMKGLFANHGVYFDSKETFLELNGCSIEAYPSNHLDAYRALDNPKFILLDEADFFRKSEQGPVLKWIDAEDIDETTEKGYGTLFYTDFWSPQQDWLSIDANTE